MKQISLPNGVLLPKFFRSCISFSYQAVDTNYKTFYQRLFFSHCVSFHCI